MAERNRIGVYAIVREQKPAGAALINAMFSVAGSQLPQHVNICLKKPIENVAEPIVPKAKQPAKMVAANDDGTSRNLAIALVCRRDGSEEQGDRRDAFSTHGADFDRAAVAHVCHDREHGIDGEIHFLYFTRSLIDLLRRS